MEQIWTNIMLRPEILVPPLIFYCIFFWGLPMICLWNVKGIPKEQLAPYWKSVGQISGIFHVATIISVGGIWLAYPYMVV